MRFKVYSAKCYEGFGDEAQKYYGKYTESEGLGEYYRERAKASKYYQDILQKYNYEPDDHITINTLEELLQLMNEVRCGLVIEKEPYEKDISIIIYDGYLE